MKSALRWLEETAPTWFTIESRTSEALVGRARVQRTPWRFTGLHLRIFSHSKPQVREVQPGTDLPARCPERHIQEDQTFCLGLRYITVSSSTAAGSWWTQLEQFLLCQGAAKLTCVWPPNHALDHGDAGQHHEKALRIAHAAGFADEYAAARLGELSWVTDPELRIFDKDGKAINGRARCPRRCRRRARGRMVDIVRVDCDKRDAVVELAATEAKRRKALEEYWQHVISQGTVCCRTMRDCRLAEHEDMDL